MLDLRIAHDRVGSSKESMNDEREGKYGKTAAVRGTATARIGPALFGRPYCD